MRKVNITLSIGTGFAFQSGKWSGEGPTRAAIFARFWSRVNRGKAKVCWPFIGRTFRPVYGCPHTLPHVFAWEAARGPVPAGLTVWHSCANTSCVNPAHLFVGARHVC